MKISPVSLTAVSLLLAGPIVWAAAAAELEFQKPLWGQVGPNQAVSYPVAAGSQDFEDFVVRAVEAPVVARVFDAEGRLLRGSFVEGVSGVSFVAPAAGQYRLEISAQTATTYHVLWARAVPLAVRLGSRKEQAGMGGPRIEALRRAVAAGDDGAVAAFWAEVRVKGAPLIEPLAGDPDRMLATFLWKGSPVTRKVLLLWPAENRIAPAACAFSHLPGTDVWFATVKVNRAKRAFYRLVENSPDLPAAPDAGGPDMGMIWDLSQSDPLNPRPLEYVENKSDAPGFLGSSLLEMPDAPAQPLLQRRPGVPAGELHTFSCPSAKLGSERQILVYTPPGFSREGAPYGAVYFADGDDYLNRMHVDALLDNLLAERRIPPLVAVLVDNPPGGRNDLFNPNFSDFLALELAPAIRRDYHVTADPRRIMVGGKSLGGYAACEAAYWFPGTFGNVISQSGGPLAPEVQRYATTGRLPVRFFLSAGTDETDRGGLVGVNRRFHRLLVAQGYDAAYVEVDGGHDPLNWRMTLPEALIRLANPPGVSR